MRTVYATPGRALDIGRYPENDTVKVVFDVKCWRKQYPAGSIALLHQRPGDDGAQPVAGLTVGSKDAEWLVSNADVLTAGEGIATLILVNGGQVELSESWKTVIGEPVTEESETPPEPIESYMTAVIEAVESYDAMTAEAEEGDTADSEIDRTGDHPVLKLTLPRGREGEPGDDGFSPIVTVTEITGGHRVTITDATGPHVFDVMDGQGGGGGGAVDSVNGKTGVVVLNANDVGALPASTPIPPAVTVDSALSGTSTNPVQNKIIKSALDQQSETIGNLSKDSTSNADFDISDPDGNVLARFKDGEIKTKNFDSGLMKMKESIKTGPDFDLTDPNGNVLMRLKNGGIQTKCFDSNDFAPNAKVITVKTDGSGDFTSLRAAVDSITDASKDNPYRIDIYPGEYDILEEYTDAEIREADVEHYTQGFPGLLLTDGISLRGVGDRSRIIIHGELETTYSTRIRFNISTLNLQGNVNLENLTISGKNIRYCVHDDFPYVGRYRRIVRNCDFIGVSLCTDPATTYGAGGWSDGCDAIFEDCDFGTDFGMHKNEAGDTLTVFKGCRGRKLNIGTIDVHSIHRFCLIDSTFEMVNDYSNITPLEITAYGCCENMMSAADHVVITGAITKIKLTDIPVGTMVTSNGKAITATTNKDIAFGVVIGHDSLWTYIQRTGHIYAGLLSLTGLAVGDYVTVNSSGLIVTGGTSSNAVGVCDYISDDADAGDDGKAFIKLL